MRPLEKAVDGKYFSSSSMNVYDILLISRRYFSDTSFYLLLFLAAVPRLFRPLAHSVPPLGIVNLLGSHTVGSVSV